MNKWIQQIPSSSASGPQHYQRFEDILIILQEMEKNEAEISGKTQIRGCLYIHAFRGIILDFVSGASVKNLNTDSSFCMSPYL